MSSIYKEEIYLFEQIYGVKMSGCFPSIESFDITSGDTIAC